MPVLDLDIQSYYTQPAVMTAPGRYAPLLDPLPHDIAGLAAVGQGLMIHEYMAQEYGVTPTEADRPSVHPARSSRCWPRSWPMICPRSRR